MADGNNQNKDQEAPQMSAALGAVGSSIKHNINALRNDKNTSFWIKGLKIITWVMFLFGIVGGFIFAIAAARTTSWLGGSNFSFGTFLGVWLGTWLGTFMATAGIMVFLDMARDVSEIKANTRNK